MSSSGRSQLRKRLAGLFVGYFDRRFEELKAQSREREAGDQERLLALERALREGSSFTPVMHHLLVNTTATAETVAGLSATISRQLDRFLRQQLADPFAGARWWGRYDPQVVQFLNRVLSFGGPIAERGLLINHPLTVLFTEDGPQLFEVNERIVEVPFVMGAAAALPLGSSIIDIGSAESTVALSLASSGHRVTAVDPRPYPFSHPNLTSVASEVERWKPDEPVDMVISLSAIEHFGLGHYTGRADGFISDAVDADRRALDHMRSWLAPGGRLVLTLPTGPASTDDFQRVYDEPRLAALVEGWQVDTQLHALRSSPLVWEMVDRPPAEGRGVALLVLR